MTELEELQEQLAYLTMCKDALKALVALKDYRIANGKNNHYYREKKNIVWADARKALEYNNS